MNFENSKSVGTLRYIYNIETLNSDSSKSNIMFLVSMTAVISFDVVGSIMVISCMIGPAAISLLVTKNL
ncbi:metal ABC transporter permease, partial ['Melaleuca sp.' phytoplasma]|nr:metal ABC transporter permease ['Melaleuca sp.' phytoplasma]